MIVFGTVVKIVVGFYIGCTGPVLTKTVVPSFWPFSEATAYYKVSLQECLYKGALPDVLATRDEMEVVK